MQNSWQSLNFFPGDLFPLAPPVHITQLWQWKPTHQGLVSLDILWNFCLNQCKQSTVTRAVHFFSFVISLPMWSCQADLRWSIISVHVRLESLSYKFHKRHYLYGSCISTSSTENWSGELGYIMIKVVLHWQILKEFFQQHIVFALHFFGPTWKLETPHR